jgi:hypothetical protein
VSASYWLFYGNCGVDSLSVEVQDFTSELQNTYIEVADIEPYRCSSYLEITEQEIAAKFEF